MLLFIIPFPILSSLSPMLVLSFSLLPHIIHGMTSTTPWINVLIPPGGTKSYVPMFSGGVRSCRPGPQSFAGVLLPFRPCLGNPCFHGLHSNYAQRHCLHRSIDRVLYWVSSGRFPGGDRGEHIFADYSVFVFVSQFDFAVNSLLLCLV